MSSNDDESDLDTIIQSVAQGGGKIGVKKAYEILCNSVCFNTKPFSHFFSFFCFFSQKIIRPPRQFYSINDLGKNEYNFGSQKFIREDIEVKKKLRIEYRNI